MVPRAHEIRGIAMWIRAIILLTPFMVPVTAAYGSGEATAALECAEWANKVFFAPSSARDDAFIDCIRGTPIWD